MTSLLVLLFLFNLLLKFFLKLKMAIFVCRRMLIYSVRNAIKSTTFCFQNKINN